MSAKVYFAGGRLGEASVADWAFVGPLSSVDSDVFLQSWFLGKVLSARVAAIGCYHLKHKMII